MKYVFIAHGIGITPFRSMIADLIVRKEKRDILLFYNTATPEDILFKELLEEGVRTIGLQIVFLHKDRVTKEMLEKQLADIHQPIYYISGPQGIVLAYQEMLLSLNVATEHIKTDSFTGYD